MESTADLIFLLYHLHSSKVKTYPTKKWGRGTFFQNSQTAALVCWTHGRETKELEADCPVPDQGASRGTNPF